MSYFVTCRIGREWYGIPIENVLEVLHLVALNDAPQSGKVGVMTLREKVIPVLDMRRYFNVVDYDYTLDTPIIAIQYDNRASGLIVDEADDVVEVNTSNAEPYGDSGIQTVLRVNDRMLFILDVPQLFEIQASMVPD